MVMHHLLGPFGRRDSVLYNSSSVEAEFVVSCKSKNVSMKEL